MIVDIYDKILRGHKFRRISDFSFIIFLSVMLIVVLNFLPVSANSDVIIVPDDYSSINEAINHSLSGDTIFVKAGSYNENIVVNKDNLRLVGENKETTIIYGSGTGNVVYMDANNTEVSGFTV